MKPSRVPQRKSAKKSRHGCQECKRRHLKCDETRPACANCTVRHSPCSFLSTTGRLPPSRPSLSASSPSSFSESATGSPRPDDAAHCTPMPKRHHACDTRAIANPPSPYEPTFTINSLVSTDQTFSLHHLELLHNFRVGVLAESVLRSSAAEGYMAMLVREAAQAPYLMDQALAVSAANMSVKRPRQQRFYREEATRLQTRGLALFNASRALEIANHAMARFVFSTLLSHQVLFDVFSVRTDFPPLLDRLVAAFRICGGVRTMCDRSWPFIMSQYQQHVGINLPAEFVANTGPETTLTRKLAHLEALLTNADLSTAIMSPCSKALGYLRNLSYADERPKFPIFRTARLLQWAVMVPPEFINLVEERRPEALVIIAYYAVLIHDTRGYWVSGDAGAFIIRSITSFLGNYWAGWLAWPNEVLDSVNSGNETSLPSAIDIDTLYSVDELPRHDEGKTRLNRCQKKDGILLTS
ncbi:hypothetical protein F4678DRAFT_408307 [Xylaria arbuscula]|nr:hypothetical protein F4678DRAFT_408307 [Xylaria arbuscula]